ncbi:hypothetical protein QN362_16365 [Actimicrobium sp. CCC2.4]|uniref:hypothetical protein n=1 Tax=Actimicrobium sp. CCC2.4 TaxID=3048606 RepID=UPI002AC990FC|nr:hypothetical protein [Actimicrobium sp. CCC2.4]MEB0136911.1 hypothetical protein [Actimicrobium sp. CCC2.4]WPX33460.1 hypothetical protein RHM62_06385 [Actimicrobium sp. CCC2.4]
MTPALPSKTTSKKPTPTTVAKPVAAKATAAAKLATTKPVRTKPVAAQKTVPTARAKPVAKAKVSTSIAFPKSLPETVDISVTKEKVKKAKLVRDSFTMPEVEYAVLSDVKKNCLKAGFEVKKSELLRIGVALIRDLDLAALKLAAATLSPLKPGRPRKEK